MNINAKAAIEIDPKQRGYGEELKSLVLNVNLDMIGSIMGKFIACCTSEEKRVHYISYMAAGLGFGIDVSQGVYSSDSTPFADRGVLAVSFAASRPTTPPPSTTAMTPSP